MKIFWYNNEYLISIVNIYTWLVTTLNHKKNKKNNHKTKITIQKVVKV